MEEVKSYKDKLIMVAVGTFVGVLAVLLVVAGNPANMGFCIACFIRDTVGALGMHRAAVVQYIRPEIIGLVLGSFLFSLFKGEFKPHGGSQPMVRFVLGFFVMIGALVFLGCPLRMVLRLAGGDLNALVALGGFILGIAAGVFFLNRGYSLGRTQKFSVVEGSAISVVQAVLLVLLVAAPSFIFFSEKGPGSMRAPIYIALIVGLAVGAAAQRTRICMVGGIRDVMLFRDFKLVLGFVGIFLGALVANIVAGKFSLGFAGQPVAHTEWLWNALGMVLVGFASALLGGCPLRQLILAGEGNSDSAITVLGLAVGAAFCHNFGLASSASGTTLAGRVACLIGLVVTAGIACAYTFGNKGGKQ